MNKISVIGAGSWGTALAQVLASAGRMVTLYARVPALAIAINKIRQNNVYLPGIALNARIRAVSVLEDSAKDADLVVLATPTQFVRETLIKLAPHLPKNVPLINAAKGIEISSGKLLSEVAAETASGFPYAILSGPTFAVEVAKGLPTAVTLATKAPEEQAQLWASALSGRAFRPYLSRDVAGAEIAGAVKNVIAIACGIVEGKGLGQNARAALMTRGMAEIKRLGLKKGAHADTFLGLSGIGDLTLTCNSLTSRNFFLGTELGRGKKLEEILSGKRAVTEGVTTAKAVADLAAALSVDMPISSAINRILHHAAIVDDVIKDLLSRDLKSESD